MLSCRFLMVVAVFAGVFAGYAEPYRNGDVVVFFGDSITHAGHYHEYISNFYRTRYPDRCIRFVNSGIGGDTAAGALRRIPEDVAEYKSTHVTFHFGMNDVNLNSYQAETSADSLKARERAWEGYRKNLRELIDGVRRAVPEAKFTYLTPTPYDDSVVLTNAPGVNRVGSAVALSLLAGHVIAAAERDGAACVDWYSALNSFVRRHQKEDPHFSVVRSDRVHPEELGHSIMAWEFLRRQGVSPVVSTVTIDAAKGHVEGVENAEISDLRCAERRVEFTLSEKSLPFPVHPKALPYVTEFAVEQALNRETLTVRGLPDGEYSLKIDGEEVGRYAAEQLDAGIGLGFNEKTPQYRQAQDVARRQAKLFEREVKLRNHHSARWYFGDKGPVDDIPAFRSYYETKVKVDGAPRWIAYFGRFIPGYLEYWPKYRDVRAQLWKDQELVRKSARPVPHVYQVEPCADRGRTVVPDACQGVPLGAVKLQGAVGTKADAWLTNRVFSSYAKGTVLDEAVEAFRTHWDDTHRPGSGDWQGEYWGKTMLGHAGAFLYTHDSEQRKFVEHQALELIREFQKENGYLGTYANEYFIGANPPQKPWSAWTCNLWNRKYTIWGLLEAYQVTGNAEILKGAVRAMDHWIGSLRHERMNVRHSGAFAGLMSMSILKPLLLLYRETGKGEYLSFAHEIVREWNLRDDSTESMPNLVRNAFSDKPVHTWWPNSKKWAKAYEMMSCLEGMCEFYRVTGERRILDAVRRLHAKLAEHEINPMWSVGHFDHFTHAAARQSGMTEPCDVIHWMRLNRELYLLTGDPSYCDWIEKAFYNAFLAGAYRDGKWGAHIVRSHGTRHFSAPHQVGMRYHQCCVDNMPRAFFDWATAIVTREQTGAVRLNFYSDASVDAGDVKLKLAGNYPVSDVVTIYATAVRPVRLKLRVPDTCDGLWIDTRRATVTDGFASLDLSGERKLSLKFDLKTALLNAPFDAGYDSSGVYEQDVAGWSKAVFEEAEQQPEMKGRYRTLPAARLMRGPLVLARARAVSVPREEIFDFETVDRKGATVRIEPLHVTGSTQTTWGAWKVEFTLPDGARRAVNVCDFQSAADYDDSSNAFSVFF